MLERTTAARGTNPTAARGVGSTGSDPSHGATPRSNPRRPGVVPCPGGGEGAWRPLSKHEVARARAGGPVDQARVRLVAVTDEVGTSLKRHEVASRSWAGAYGGPSTACRRSETSLPPGRDHQLERRVPAASELRSNNRRSTSLRSTKRCPSDEPSHGGRHLGGSNATFGRAGIASSARERGAAEQPEGLLSPALSLLSAPRPLGIAHLRAERQRGARSHRSQPAHAQNASELN